MKRGFNSANHLLNFLTIQLKKKMDSKLKSAENIKNIYFMPVLWCKLEEMISYKNIFIKWKKDINALPIFSIG